MTVDKATFINDKVGKTIKSWVDNNVEQLHTYYKQSMETKGSFCSLVDRL